MGALTSSLATLISAAIVGSLVLLIAASFVLVVMMVEVGQVASNRRVTLVNTLSMRMAGTFLSLQHKPEAKLRIVHSHTCPFAMANRSASVSKSLSHLQFHSVPMTCRAGARM